MKLPDLHNRPPHEMQFRPFKNKKACPNSKKLTWSWTPCLLLTSNQCCRCLLHRFAQELGSAFAWISTSGAQCVIIQALVAQGAGSPAANKHNMSQIKNLLKFYSCARCFAHLLAALSPPFLPFICIKRGSKILQFCILFLFFLVCRVCCSKTFFLQAKDRPQIIAFFVGLSCMLFKRRLQKNACINLFFCCLSYMLFKHFFTSGLQQHLALVQTSPCKQPVPSNNPASSHASGAPVLDCGIRMLRKSSNRPVKQV